MSECLKFDNRREPTRKWDPREDLENQMMERQKIRIADLLLLVIDRYPGMGKEAAS